MNTKKNRNAALPKSKKLKAKETSPSDDLTLACADDDCAPQEIEPIDPEIEIVQFSPVAAVEEILNYRFTDKSLLEEALTHSSFTESASYQRLEFIGDAALGLALANFVFIAYPDLDPGQLSILRAANISTEKLARVAIRNNLYSFMRHCAPSLDQKVKEFAIAIEEEGDEVIPYGGSSVKAPKVLADIVEAIAAAIYVDCNFDLKLMWEYFSPLLEPIATLDNLEAQPVTMIYEHCQKQGKNVDFKNWKKGSKNICNVFVDGKLVGAGCSEQRHIAKLNAAKEALEKVLKWEQNMLNMQKEQSSESATTMDVDGDMIGVEEIEGAKQKLNEFCDKKRWPKPTYRVEKEVGPAHRKKFICSVHIETLNGLYTSGDMKARVKDAENSAASIMLYSLREDRAQIK